MLRKLFVAACIILLSSNSRASEIVSIQLRWDHQFQFAGYYAAKWLGYYEEAGFDVEIRSAITPDGKILRAAEEVSAGRANFGVGAAEILIARDRGDPLVVLGVIFQQSAAEFYALEGTRFNSPSDMLDLRVARNIGGLVDIEMQAMLRAEGIDPKKIKSFPHTAGVRHLLDGRVDVVPGYRISAPHELRVQNVRFKTMRPVNYGIDFYGDSLFAHQRRVERDPDSAKRFLAATLKGWEYALKHPAKIVEKIANDLPRTAGIEGGVLEFNHFQAKGVKELALYPVVEVGHTNPHRWRRMHEFMKKIGILKKPFQEKEFIFDFDMMKREKEEALFRTLKTGGYLAAGIFLVVLAWSLALRRTVAQKMLELRLVNKRLDRDNASLRQMEMSLTRSEKKFRDLIERMGEGVWIIDENAFTTFVNPGMAEMLGYDEAEMLGRHLFYFMNEKGKEIVARKLELRKTGIQERHDFEFVRKDGKTLHTIVDTKPIYDESRNYAGAFAVITDITEKKLMEENLALALQRLTAHLENSPLGVVEFDPQFRISRWSNEAENIFGWSSDEVMGKSVSEFKWVCEEDSEPVARESANLFSGERKRSLNVNRNYRKDGSVITCEWYNSAMYDSEGRMTSILSLVLDITVRLRAEAQLKKYSERLEDMVEERTLELKKTRDELLLNERLAVLGHFAGSISHEIRNPLAAIDSSVYFLKMKLKRTDEKIDEHLERVTSNVKNASAIIESLLNLTRMEKPKMKKHRLPELVSKILEKETIPDTIEVVAHLPDTGPLVDVDIGQIQMALGNVIKNAVQAMDKSGTLKVSARCPEEGTAELCISDNGPGIPTETMSRIFDPLYTTKAQGIGFGLSITKMIVENHGGSVRVESLPEKGTDFKLTLPVPKNGGEK